MFGEEVANKAALPTTPGTKSIFSRTILKKLACASIVVVFVVISAEVGVVVAVVAVVAVVVVVENMSTKDRLLPTPGINRFLLYAKVHFYVRPSDFEHYFRSSL